MTKTQRRANASRKSKQRRVSKALKTFLKKVNPGILKRTSGAKLRKNRGGSITIIPIKLGRAR